ncbi:hypothetical protein BOV90_12060 [Solemya velum gill symbiont]|uniref:Uncharacterized protein n=1 Tax=Solemya velum gill symbiont TaxID=2340 RepID=A0A1T2CRK7_SOVGS|nr:hypothetical protein [Solemya velum gill symbiont]OOY34599.1 hypothetical protein BOV88_09095 [Solemya velum gill symbiont]OOY37391.1 hypothetical protein BOV89_07525 [Solemya velum gill symbiont]OOY38924.1 hypothetical protein BOV90_12060 [Solemya velum gill symbiont]OOY42667.1 hypothetical protein BOV91_06275 [Solemya velum gill symbiont]OOY43409.1 hypothetical protein BOV92_11310 [Solemya velum gill symbiont]
MHTAVEIVVESLCQNGCKAVWGYIAELEAGRTLPDTESLNDVQRCQVLIELKEIMAVYGETSCTLDDAIATVEAKYSTGS